MAWYQISDKQLPEQMMAQFNDAAYVSLDLNELTWTSRFNS